MQTPFSSRATMLGPRTPLLARMTGGLLDRQVSLGYLLLTPALVFIAIFLGYPFVYGIWLSLTDSQIGSPGTFIGLANYAYLLKEPIFIRTLVNTFEYTFVTVVFKFVLGLAMAAGLSVKFRGNRWMRAAMLLPFILPTVLSTLAWLWMFDSTFGVINWVLYAALHVHGPNWLGTGAWPMTSLMIVNIWRGIPFFGILVLAAMETVPQDLYEAAEVDGAAAIARYFYVTLPTIRPVVLIATLLSLILTFGDFQIVWILTAGGPANSTHILGTYAFQTGINGTEIGIGAAIALTLFPFLAVMVAGVLWILGRE